MGTKTSTQIEHTQESKLKGTAGMTYITSGKIVKILFIYVLRHTVSKLALS